MPSPVLSDEPPTYEGEGVYHPNTYHICGFCRAREDGEEKEKDCACKNVNYKDEGLSRSDGRLVEGGPWTERLDTLPKVIDAKRRAVTKAAKSAAESWAMDRPVRSENSDETTPWCLFSEQFAKENLSRACAELATAELRLADFLAFLKLAGVEVDEESLSARGMTPVRIQDPNAAEWTDPE